MQPFNFEFATSEKNAVESNSGKLTSRFIAGGTTLVDLMKLHVEIPDHVVGLGQLPLKKISEKDGSVFVGALVTNSDMAHSPLVSKNFPVLSQALLSGASVQLRNLATTGGNLLQRTRCSYFRDTSCACNKRNPGSGCSAIEGQNRMHAVLGGSSQCIASHPSDMCVALAALGAKIHVASLQGERVIPFADFHRLPGETPQIENSLQPGELVTSVEIPKTSWFKHSAYVKIRDRASYAFALTSVAVALDLENGNVRNSRIAFGGLGTVPWRSPEAEFALQGKKLTVDQIKIASKAALEKAKTTKHNSFKVTLAQQTLVRALTQLGGLS